jgi:hypothetical protein
MPQMLIKEAQALQFNTNFKLLKFYILLEAGEALMTCHLHNDIRRDSTED